MLTLMLRSAGTVAAALLACLLILPLLAMVFSATPATLGAGFSDPSFLPALMVSLRSSMISLIIMIAGGLPLAWFLACTSAHVRRWGQVMAMLPIVIPPAVLGVALLMTFGRQGLLAGSLPIPFTEVAVVMAQVVVAAPFFVLASTHAFRQVDQEEITVARTLGATSTEAFFRVAIPSALPGILAGASLAWARALGEFGATLVFAGNLMGETQTMPLAIFTALESNVQTAVVFSLFMVAVGVVLIAALQLAPRLWRGATEFGGRS